MWVKYLQITPDRVYYKCKGNTDWTYYAELGASCLRPKTILNSDDDTGEFFRVKILYDNYIYIRFCQLYREF